MTMAVSDGRFPAHPVRRRRLAGVHILFATEMWERFSYYGMRVVLVFYLMDELGRRPAEAIAIYKWYTTLSFMAPILGGYLADRWMGASAAIVAGALAMTAGHAMMAAPSGAFLYPALALLVVGTGLFKPNMVTMLGRIYPTTDARRDAAFTIFYMAMNLGGALAPIVCGELLRRHFGFHAGFGAAAVGMAAALGIFLAGRSRVYGDISANGAAPRSAPGPTAEPHGDRESETPGAPLGDALVRVWPVILLGIGVSAAVLSSFRWATGRLVTPDLLLICLFAGASLWAAALLRRFRGTARRRATVVFVLFFFSALYWMAAEQAGSALALWADSDIRRQLGSYRYGPELFQAVNPLLILFFSPLLARVWTVLGRHSRNPSVPAKFVIALALTGVAFAAALTAAVRGDRVISEAPLDAVPATVALDRLNAGRMSFNAADGRLRTRGVLSRHVELEALRQAIPPSLAADTDRLEADAAASTATRPLLRSLSAKLRPLTQPPPSLSWNAATGAVTATGPLGAAGKLWLYQGAAPATWSRALQTLRLRTQSAQIGAGWLFATYALLTLGELFLAPVGLAMVTRLAPKEHASAFVGVWLLAHALAQYLSGTLSERWSNTNPASYFAILVVTSAGAAVVMVPLGRLLRRMMGEAGNPGPSLEDGMAPAPRHRSPRVLTNSEGAS